MGRYDRLEPAAAAEPDYWQDFTVFMLIFWPFTLLLGLIDFFWVTSYDLRLVNLMLAGAAGWLGVVLYRRRQEREREASS